jgi:hypothetical protein
VIFINDSIAEKFSEDKDEITKFFEHDEREEMSLKEEVIGNNQMENFDDLLDEFMKGRSTS